MGYGTLLHMSPKLSIGTGFIILYDSFASGLLVTCDAWRCVVDIDLGVGSCDMLAILVGEGIWLFGYQEYYLERFKS